MNKILLIISSLLVFIGCQLMNKNSNKSIRLPQKVTIQLPKLLSRKNLKQEKRNQKIIIENTALGEYAVGYQFIKMNLSFFEDIDSIMTSQLFFIDKIMNKIQKKCLNTHMNQSCKIEEISIRITPSLFKEYQFFLNKKEDPINIEQGGEIIFKKLEFIHNDSIHLYTYNLKFNFGERYLEDNIKEAVQKVQWSNKNNSVLSSLGTKKLDSTQELITIYYNQTEKEEMNFHLREINLPNDIDINLDFNILKENANYIVKALNIQEEEEEKNKDLFVVSTYIKLNNNGGFDIINMDIKEENSNNNIQYAQHDTFDSEGHVVNLSFCLEYFEECSINNQETWFSNIEESVIKNMPKYFDKITIEGEYHLENGVYYLLPNNTNFDKLSLDFVAKHKIAEFLSLKNSIAGVLYKREYSKQLNDLQLVYAQYDENIFTNISKQKKQFFKLIPKQDKPNFIIKINNIK